MSCSDQNSCRYNKRTFLNVAMIEWVRDSAISDRLVFGVLLVVVAGSAN